MSSRIEHLVGVDTDRTPRFERRSSYTAEEAVSAKAEIDAMFANEWERRTAGAMKGHITRRTVGYVSKPKQLLDRMIRESAWEHVDWMLKMSEPVANDYIAMSVEVEQLLTSTGMTIEELCETRGFSVDFVKGLIDTANAIPPIDIDLPSATVLLPISKIRGVNDWLHEYGIQPKAYRIEERDGVRFDRFDFESDEDAMLFRLRFL